MLPKITNVYRLTRDPEVRYMQDGTTICSVNLACSEKYKDKETVLFLNGTAFGKTGEFLSSVTKGQRVLITGKLKTESWEKDGQKHSKTAMLIDSFEYIEARNSAPAAPQAPADYAPNQGNDVDFDDSSVPF